MQYARVWHWGIVSCLAAVLTAVLLVLALAACGSAAPTGPDAPAGSSTPAVTERPSSSSSDVFPQSDTTLPSEFSGTLEPPPSPTPTPGVNSLFDPNLSLRAGPVPVPLRLTIPSIKADAPVIGVGLNADNVMDAPGGEEGDPIYEKVFWYRGSGVPGTVGTATIAGHVTGRVGEPAVFAHLEEVRVGDVVVVSNMESGQQLTFMVTETQLYSIEEASDPAVLERVYGHGPVLGVGPLPSPDGLAHLTLITCGGDWRGNGFSHRFVVFAQLIGPD